jgi:putative membrane protein
MFLVRASNWPVEWPLAAIAVAAALYRLGGFASATPGDARKRGRGAAFYAGLLTLALAIDSPIDAYADSLFWVHMVQHVLLTMVAPPLLLLGRPWPRVVRPLPLAARRPVARVVLSGDRFRPLRTAARWLAAPLPAFVLFNGTLLAWHVPVLFDLTLRDGAVHDLEHALFFTTGLLFWTNVLPRPRPALADAGRALYATGAVVVSWVLALVLGLASSPLYAGYASLHARPTGISALADQQLAAGVMWVPGSVPLTIALLFAASSWLAPAAARRRSALHGDDLRPRET